MSQGKISLSLSPLKEGVTNLYYIPYTGDQAPTPPANLDVENPYFSAVRCLPFDNELIQLPDDQVTWQKTYDEQDDA